MRNKQNEARGTKDGGGKDFKRLHSCLFAVMFFIRRHGIIIIKTLNLGVSQLCSS